jgi:hypothetical protein
MAGIFINYRRDDSRGLAGRLADNLRRAFGSRAVFMDVDGMKPGLDFVKQLDAQVSQCDVVLAVIGTNWFEARDDKGQRRFDSEHDYVRIELASALKRDIPVIPVLVDGAALPPEEALPDDLKSLARRHAMELRYTRFNADAHALELALRDLLPRRRYRWLLPVLGGIAVAAAAGIAAFVFWPGPTPPPPPIINPPKPVTQNVPKTPAIDTPKSGTQSVAKAPAVVPPVNRAPEPSRVGEDLRVVLGDSIDRVKAAYDIKSEPFLSNGTPTFNLPLSGIWFFFSAEDKTALGNIRVDAPFGGRVEGVRIGDPVADILSRFGEPYTKPWDFAGNKAHVYRIGGRVVRFDIDPSNKVATIFQFK